jgi:hypothetical protein
MHISRRMLLLTLIAAGAPLAVTRAFADLDDEDDSEGGGGGGGSDGGDTSESSDQDNDNLEDNLTSDDLIDTDSDPLGLSCRAPSLSGEGMTWLQMLGTGSKEAPDSVGVEAGNYSEDQPLKGIGDSSESFLDDAIVKLQEASTYLVSDVRSAFEELYARFSTPPDTEPSFWTEKWFNFKLQSAWGDSANGMVQTSSSSSLIDPIGSADSGYITLWVPVTELNGFYSTNGYGPEGYYNAMGAYFGVKGVELFGQSELTTQAPNIEVRVRAGPAELRLSIDAGPMVESGGRVLENLELNMYDYETMMQNF